LHVLPVATLQTENISVGIASAIYMDVVVLLSRRLHQSSC
jgi:hypothetical protein